MRLYTVNSYFVTACINRNTSIINSIIDTIMNWWI